MTNIHGAAYSISGQSFFAHLTECYGTDVTSLFRSCIRHSRTIIRHSCQLKFLLACKRNNWIPHTFNVTSPINTALGRDIAFRTSMKFIGAKITNLHQILRSHRGILHNLCQRLHASIHEYDFRHILTFLHTGNSTLLSMMTTRHAKKLSQLQDKFKPKTPRNLPRTSHQCQQSWIKNLSSKTLTPAQENSLRLGFNFAITPKSIDVPAILSSVESITHLIPPPELPQFRSTVTRIIHNSYAPKPNIPKTTADSIQELANDDSLTFVRADKGSSIVIYDSDAYKKAVLDLLENKNRCIEIKRDTNLTYQRKLNALISSFENTDLISKQTTRKLRCHTSSTPHFYGLPKLHKPGYPLRPITAFFSSPVMPLSRFLFQELKNLQDTSIFSICSSQQFLDELHLFTLNKTDILASFDVVDLYSSIPYDLAIESVEELLYTTSTNLQYNSWIMKLISFTLKCNTVSFDGRFFSQIHGLPMGSQLSGIIAEIVMRSIETKLFLLFPNIRFWRRYIDDIFIITNKEDLKLIFDAANNINQHIHFTIESENNKGEIPFLDILCCRQANTLLTSVYRKPSNTSKYLNYNSNHHKSHRLSICRSLYNRCSTHCNNNASIISEKRRIRHELLLNDYPPQLINSFERNMIPGIRRHPTYPPQQYLTTVAIPYFHGVTEKIAKELKKWNIRTAYRPLNKLQQQICRKKDVLPSHKWNMHNLVYQIPCNDCSETYIGQTKRFLKTRISEHQSYIRKQDQNSLVTTHCIHNNHSMNWDNVKILKSNLPSIHHRLFYESWLTNCSTNPTINVCKTLPNEYTSLIPRATKKNTTASHNEITRSDVTHQPVITSLTQNASVLDPNNLNSLS